MTAKCILISNIKIRIVKFTFLSHFGNQCKKIVLRKLLPANKVLGKVKFLHLPVSHSVHGGGEIGCVW